MEPSSDPLDALIDTFFAHVKRRMFSAKVLELAHAESDPSKWNDLDTIMLDAAKDLSVLVPSGRVSRFSEMESRVDQYRDEVANPDQRQAIMMNIEPFDEASGGIRPGNLVTVAGYSGLGKSMLSQFLLMSAYEQNATGLLLTLEMTAEEVFERFDTMVMNFSHKLMSQRILPDEKVDLWSRIAKQFAGAKNDIVVVDRAMGCTTDRVYAEIERYKPDICVVDYVQLMRSRQNYASQWQSLVDITNDLKSIALASDTAIVMVSQDGRDAAENGSTDRNMGGSISVYQAADIYLGLHQTDEMYAEDQMEVRFLKNRRGKKMLKANLLWRPATMTFKYEDQETAHRAFTRQAA